MTKKAEKHLLTRSGEKQLKKLVESTKKVFKEGTKEHKHIIIKHAAAWRELAKK